jgi:SAM-dependent methyltransferase
LPVAASIFGGFFTTGNYIIWYFVNWWPPRKSSLESLPVSMAGIKLGDRLLVVGCADPLLIAQLAVKTGLTGRAYAVDERSALVAAAEKVAAREGALIETASAPWTALPVRDNEFDVAIVRDVLPHLTPEQRASCIREVQRALRPGGRCLVVDGSTRSGFLSRARGAVLPPDYTGPGGLVAVLAGQGLKAARILAERDGLTFAEAVKPMG